MDTDPIKDVVINIRKVYSNKYVKDAFGLLIKLFSNILKDRTEEKFRIFNKGNESIQKRVLIIKESLDLLKAMGYIDITEDSLAFNGSNFSNIETTVKILQAEVDEITKSEMSKEDVENMERDQAAKKNLEEVRRKMQEEKEKQMIIKKQMEADKKEIEQREKPGDSKASNLGYGMKECKVEFKSSEGGPAGGG